MIKKCKILLVDDERDVVDVLKRGLEQYGFEVDAYTSPTEALASFKVGVHDLLVLDIRMPGLTGIQLFKEIRTIDPKVKALFLTAFEIHEKEWHIMFPSTDVSAFIKKPVRIHQLVSAISQVKVSL